MDDSVFYVFKNITKKILYMLQNLYIPNTWISFINLISLKNMLHLLKNMHFS